MTRTLPLALLLAACVGIPAGWHPPLPIVTAHGAAWRPVGATANWVPPGSAAFLNGKWWGLITAPTTIEPSARLDAFGFGEVTAASAADLDGDGAPEIVVSYRHPVRSVPWDPRPLPTDARGRSAHLGVVRADGSPVWLARRIPHPIGAVAACGPVIALAYTSLDDDAVTATTAAAWHGFGFTLGPELPGPGVIGCADVDGDGTPDPVVLR